MGPMVDTLRAPRETLCRHRRRIPKLRSLHRTSGAASIARLLALNEVVKGRNGCGVFARPFQVSNTIAVVGSDVAGNTITTNLNITVSMSAPTSLTVAPPNPSMTIGGTQGFTAIDQTGNNFRDSANHPLTERYKVIGDGNVKIK
ncbi:MAG TPA: hypothetical protein VMB47_17285 [Candidatus Aquilonibacter sp.]|nr:hypothetical protein [Candidatus Aquilonibacter sp.]